MTAWANPYAPNLPDFVLFVRESMGIDPLLLPDGSFWFDVAFRTAVELCVSAGCGGALYTLAVYNLGGHTLLRVAQDQPSTGPMDPGRTFFRTERDRYGLLLPSAGVVQASSDETTSDTLAVPDQVAQLTIGDLQYMKTPWGRAYLSFAGDFGPDVVGLT